MLQSYEAIAQAAGLNPFKTELARSGFYPNLKFLWTCFQFLTIDDELKFSNGNLGQLINRVRAI